MASFNIGKFRTLEHGDLIGSMATATVRMSGVRFLKLRKAKDSQPDYRIVSQGGAEMGAAWEKASKKDGLVYLSGYFDAPELPAAVNFAAFQKNDEYVMTWSRPKPKQSDEDDMGGIDFGSASDPEDQRTDSFNTGEEDPFGTEDTLSEAA